MASETGLCNRLREDGASTVEIEIRTISHHLSLPYGITVHGIVTPYLQSPSHRLETDWMSETEPNPTNLSQAFAGTVLMPASLKPCLFSSSSSSFYIAIGGQGVEDIDAVRRGRRDGGGTGEGQRRHSRKLDKSVVQLQWRSIQKKTQSYRKRVRRIGLCPNKQQDVWTMTPSRDPTTPSLAVHCGDLATVKEKISGLFWPRSSIEEV